MKEPHVFVGHRVLLRESGDGREDDKNRGQESSHASSIERPHRPGITNIPAVKRRIAAFGLFVVIATLSSSDEPIPPLRIYGLGDMGEPGSTLNRSVELLAAAVKRAMSSDDAVVYLGDNFYPDGLQGGDDKRVPRVVRGVLDDSGLRGVQRSFGPDRVLAVPGNHEYYEHLVFGRLPIGFSEKGDGVRTRAAEFGWRYAGGRADVVYLNAPDGARVALFTFDSALGVAGSDERIDRLMEELGRLLKESEGRTDWRVLAMHHPIETRGDHGHSFDREEEHDWFRRHSFPHKLDTCSRTFQHFASRLSRVITSSGARVDAVLSGHDHNLQILPLTPKDAFQPRLQIVSGSASKVHGETRRLGPGEFLNATSGFVEIFATKERLGATFHADTPCLFDSGGRSGFRTFEMSAGGPIVASSPCAVGPR